MCLRKLWLAFGLAALMVTQAAAYDSAVPAAGGAFKSYMDYGAIRAKESVAYRLQHDGSAYTAASGLRMYGDGFYMVAVGSYYGSPGDKITVEMENGTVFHAVIGDAKSDRDTDPSNRYHLSDGSVIEFLVDTDALDRSVRVMGDVSYLTEMDLSGRVAAITPYREPVREVIDIPASGMPAPEPVPVFAVAPASSLMLRNEGMYYTAALTGKRITNKRVPG